MIAPPFEYRAFYWSYLAQSIRAALKSEHLWLER